MAWEDEANPANGLVGWYLPSPRDGGCRACAGSLCTPRTGERGFSVAHEEARPPLIFHVSPKLAQATVTRTGKQSPFAAPAPTPVGLHLPPPPSRRGAGPRSLGAARAPTPGLAPQISPRNGGRGGDAGLQVPAGPGGAEGLHSVNPESQDDGPELRRTTRGAFFYLKFFFSF